MEISPSRVELLDTATTARILMRKFGHEDNDVSPPESWQSLPPELQKIALKRSADKAAFTSWYRWYRETKPNVTQEDKDKAWADIKPRYRPVATLDLVSKQMTEDGYEDLLKAIADKRAHIAGSAITYLRAIEEETLKLSEDEFTCLAYVYQGLSSKDDDKIHFGLFLTGAYEGGDDYITNLWRVMKALGHPLSPAEFGVASNAVNDYLAKNAYQWRPMSMADVMYQEYGPHPFELERDVSGNLKSVRYAVLPNHERMRLLELPAVKSLYNVHEEDKIHTGCPAMHAKTNDLDPNNPVKFLLQELSRTAYLALFPHHVPGASLRAATKMTL